MLYHINNARHSVDENLCSQCERLLRAAAAACFPWSLVRNGPISTGNDAHSTAVPPVVLMRDGAPVLSAPILRSSERITVNKETSEKWKEAAEK